MYTHTHIHTFFLVFLPKYAISMMLHSHSHALYLSPAEQAVQALKWPAGETGSDQTSGQISTRGSWCWLTVGWQGDQFLKIMPYRIQQQQLGIIWWYCADFCEGLGKTWNVDFLSQLDSDKTQVLCDFALPRDCMLCGGDLSKGEGNHLLEVGRSDHLICI